MWPEILKAKRNADKISIEIEKLMKNHNALTKKEIASHRDQLVSGTQESILLIEAEIVQLRNSMKSHRKQLEARAAFLKRHNKRI